MGSGQVKSVSVLLFVLLFINFIIFDFARFGFGISCPNMDYYSIGNATVTNSSSVFGWDDIKDLVMGRCSGMPSWFVLLIELPLIGAFFYVLITLLPLT
jgi:hypothetical protein